MSTKARKDSKISWYIKAPVRALGKARDFYVRSFSNCAGNVGYAGVAYGGPQMAPLPRSFSVNSSASSNDEDFRELMRAASTRSLDNKQLQLELLKQQQAKQSPVAGVSVVPRSQSVAVWRIDEDKPFDQFEDVKVNTDVLPRSRTYVVSRRSRKL